MKPDAHVPLLRSRSAVVPETSPPETLNTLIDGLKDTARASAEAAVAAVRNKG